MKKAIIILLAIIIAGAGALIFIRYGKILPTRSTTSPTVSEAVETTLTTATATTTAAQTTKTNPNEDLLILVNFENPLPKDYKLNLTDTEFHQKIDVRASKALEKMLGDCRAAGYKPLPCSGYRSKEKQRKLFDVKKTEYLRKGMSEEKAEQAASEWVARPGTSEHHTGLAMDIVDLNYQLLDKRQEQTGTQKWLMKHCTEYGFILRYPTDKKAVTHINYEPWHYRYVGKENAKKIAESGLCLEEYLEKVNG